MVLTRDQILQLLNSLSSPDNSIRFQSEQTLNEAQKLSGIGVELVQITLDQSLPLHIRQLGSLTLKKYVKENWLEGEDSFVGPQTSDQDKQQIRQLLPNGLSDPESKIRTVVAMAIASIAHWDWPNQWPNLVENLIECLNPSPQGGLNPNLVKGAICCLDFFADSDNLSDEHLPNLLTLLLPPMYRIFSDTNYPDSIRMRAISILNSLIRWLAIIKRELKQHINFFFQSVFPSWFTCFSQILEKPDNPELNSGLKVSVLKVLNHLTFEFPKKMKQFVPQIVERIWASVVNGVEIYEKLSVNNEVSIEIKNLDADEEVEGFDELVSELWEFLAVLLEKKDLRSILRSQLPAIFFIGIPYMQITQDQEELWSSDPNQFVSDEEDSFNSQSIRSSVSEFISSLIDFFENEALTAFSLAISKRLDEANNKRQQNKNWWKLKEAIVSMVSSASYSLLEMEGFDILTFVSNVLLPEVETSNAFLKGTCLFCSSKFSTKLPPELSASFLTVCSQSLTSKEDPPPVKIGACRAIGIFCPKLKPEVLNPFLPSILTGTTALLPTATEDTLHLVLESLLESSKINPEITAQYCNVIVTYLLAIWTKFSKDPMILELTQSILSVFLTNSFCSQQAGDQILPPVFTFLKDSHEIPGLTSSSLILLTSFINGSSNLPDLFLTQTFPIVIQKIFNTKDSELIQEGTICLSAYVTKSAMQLNQWKPDGNITGIQMILQFIAMVLNSEEDSGATRIGFLTFKIISLFSDQLGSTVADILRAILIKLEQHKTPSLLQPLLMVFIRLIHNHPSILSFLSGLTHPSSNTNALYYILSLWTKNHEEFRGDYNIKLSIITLVELFQLALKDQSLQSITVPGELEVDSKSSGIKTRSKTKNQGENIETFTTVPLILKIIQILLREYQVIEESKQIVHLGESSEDDEEEGEDKANNEEFETIDDDVHDSPFVDADYFDRIEDDEEEEGELEDIDINDPILKLDLQAYITQFFVSFAQSNPSYLNELGKQLNPLDQETLLLLIKH